MRVVLAALTVAALSGLSLAGVAAGQYISIYRSSPWEAHRDAPYAVWNAESKAVAGSEVTINASGLVVDSAPLVPQELFATDQDLVEGSRVWLPKDGLLMKMHGAGGNWFCTWRYDVNADATDAKFLIKKGVESELCLQADAEGHTSGTRFAQTDSPAVMTMGWFGTRISQDDIESTNSVILHGVDPRRLPSRANYEVVAERNGKKACLVTRLASMHTDPTCFDAIGASLDIGGGRFTLTSMADKKSIVIRIDSPIGIRGLRPRA